MKCCICGPVRNCGPFLDKVLSNIEKIGALFDDYKILIFYDESSDNSLEKLKQYQDEGSDVQIHTAEMWSQLWNSYLCAEVAVSEKLDFVWATDGIKEMSNKPITHFAGAPGEGSFRKVDYINPFIEDLSNVTIKENCAYHWKTLIEKYKYKSFSNK